MNEKLNYLDLVKGMPEEEILEWEQEMRAVEHVAPKKKYMDLTGKKFGKWTVISLSSKRSSYGKIQWYCNCDCGRIKGQNRLVTQYNLIAKKSKSCGGCVHRKIKNLIGNKYGKLTVISLSSKRNKEGRVQWYCNCDCGNKNILKVGKHLKSGYVKSCGCLQTDVFNSLQIQNLVGQRFGKLLVTEIIQERNNTKDKRVQHKCKCDCGNEVITTSRLLITGHKKSCSGGCLYDIKGKRFGKLVAIRKTTKKQGANRIWKCKCDCGNMCLLSTGVLKVQKSCGCLATSMTTMSNAQKSKQKIINNQQAKLGDRYNLTWEESAKLIEEAEHINT